MGWFIYSYTVYFTLHKLLAILRGEIMWSSFQTIYYFLFSDMEMLAISWTKQKPEVPDTQNNRMWESSMDTIIRARTLPLDWPMSEYYTYNLQAVWREPRYSTSGSQPGALWWARGWDGWLDGRFKQEGIYVNLWLIHVCVQQKPTQCCKEIILQLKISLKKGIPSSFDSVSSSGKWTWTYSGMASLKIE